MSSSIHLNGYIGNRWQRTILNKANQALMYVFYYLSRRRSWQIETAYVAMESATHNNVYTIKTYAPIIWHNITFHCGKLETIDHWVPNETVYSCWCAEHIRRPNCCCLDVWWTIDMTEIWPWSILWPWQYKISWWSFSGWNLGNTVSFMLPPNNCCATNCDTIYITYSAWTTMMSCVNDDIPLPDEYIVAYWMILEWLLWIQIWDTQSLKENIMITMWKELLESLDWYDTQAPRSFVPW